MKNYSEVIGKRKQIKSKKVLVDQTINETDLSKYQVIAKMFDALVKEIDDLKKTLFEDLSATNHSKEKAEKISKIAFTLQTWFDTEKR